MTQNKFSIPSLEALLEADILDPERVSDAQVDELLAQHGVDVEQLNDKAQELESMLKEGQLHWQSDARKIVDRTRTILDRPPRPNHLHARRDILDALAQMRRHPSFGQEVAAYFRHRAPEDATDEELMGLLEDLKTLLELVDHEE